jgi:DNA-binding GntR family transcriptional regulator
MQLYGRNYVTHLVDSLTTSIDEHGAIVDAIKRGDADAADLATRINWTNACERYAETIKNVGERGNW